jgi:hypothetical protein
MASGRSGGYALAAQLRSAYEIPSREDTLNITSEYLADLLIGVARAQNAIIDAMERANPGFRNTHLVPIVTVAANMRAGDPRMIDLPSRILLRLQGRVALDNAAVKADVERLASGVSAAPAGAKPGAPKPAASDDGPDELDFSADK